MVSDVRVTLKTGEALDMVQKSYLVGNFILAGFAGSVRIGFDLLQSLSLMLRPAKEETLSNAWDPSWVARTWAPEAKRVFNASPKLEQQLGARLLMVGVSPTQKLGASDFHRVQIVRFASPDFLPGFLNKQRNICHIGTGSGVTHYTRALKSALRVESGLFAYESVGFGWWGTKLAHDLSQVIADHPRKSISHNLVVHAARLGEVVVRTNDLAFFSDDGDSPDSIVMPPLATSYRAFLDEVNGGHHRASCATC